MFADLKNDFVFRRIFAHHPDLTQALLNDLLDLQGEHRIVSLELLSPEQAPLVTGAKLSILDLKARDQSGRLFVVEVQLLHASGFLNRVVYNACKTYAAQLTSGQKYTDLADVIAVSFCDFLLWPEVAGRPVVPLVSRWSLSEEVSGVRDLKQVQYAFVELPKVTQEGPLKTAGERWAWLFRYGKDLAEVPEGLSEAQEQTLKLAEETKFTAAEAEAYRKAKDEIEQAQEVAEEARRKGREAGLQEGREALLRAERETQQALSRQAMEAQQALSRQAREQARQAVVDLTEVLGIELTEERKAHLAGLEVAGLEALRQHLKQHRC